MEISVSTKGCDDSSSHSNIVELVVTIVIGQEIKNALIKLYSVMEKR